MELIEKSIRDKKTEGPEYLRTFSLNDPRENDKQNYNITYQTKNHKPEDFISAKTLDKKCILLSGAIKKVYRKIEDAPKFPEVFIGITAKGKNKKKSEVNEVYDIDLLNKLRCVVVDNKKCSGEWHKIYKDGWDEKGKKISIHFFRHKSTGIVFDVDVKKGWSVYSNYDIVEKLQPKRRAV